MEILIDDIPEEGLQIQASENDTWFAGLLVEAVGRSRKSTGKAHVEIKIFKFDDNLNVDGDVVFDSHHSCDRCLSEYEATAQIHIHTILIPACEERSRKGYESDGEIELEGEDLEFGYYEGDRFDLADVLREQILLAEPMKHICREDCQGLCQKCGKNLNDGPCGCKIEKGDLRWKVLKNLKLPSDN